MTTQHNSNIMIMPSFSIASHLMLPPVMLLLGWEEYRQHWLHTGVLLGEVGDRGHGPSPDWRSGGKLDTYEC